MGELIIPRGVRMVNGQRRLPPPICEYTAPGSETEGVDCWAEGTVRHVNPDGNTLGVSCQKHTDEVAFYIQNLMVARYGRKAGLGDVTIELMEN